MYRISFVRLKVESDSLFGFLIIHVSDKKKRKIIFDVRKLLLIFTIRVVVL